MGISKELRERVFERDNYTCVYCGKKYDKYILQIDHVIPKVKGGKTDLSNLVTSCPSCNMKKSDKLIEEFTRPISNQIAKKWINLFKKSPKLTSLISLVGILITILSMTAVDLWFVGKPYKDKTETNTYNKQIENLEATQKNIKELLLFIDAQKKQLSVAEENLSKLKKEKEILEPMLTADKAVVESLLKLQEERNQKYAEREKIMGFVYGVVASMLASVLLMIIRYSLLKFRRSITSSSSRPL